MGIANETTQGNYETYFMGFIYTSKDGINWTSTLSPNDSTFKGTTTDGKGNIVILAYSDPANK